MIHEIHFRQIPGRRFAALALLLLSAMNPTTSSADPMLFEFSRTNTAAWQTVNDDVMGGVSTSCFQMTNGMAVFRGELSLENNGGFASVRSQAVRSDLTGCDVLLLRVRGDGRRYKFTARMDQSFESVLYQAAFKTRAGEWDEVRLEARDFVPTFRGRVLSGEPPLDPASLTSVGFLISDKQAGAFHLEIAWIKALRARQR